MRTASAFIVSLVAIAAPAIANQCYWSNGHIYCNAGCRVTDRWWEGGRDWMSYSCIPPFLTDPAFIMAAIAFAVIVVAAAITSGSWTNAHEADIEQIERDMATTDEVKKSMEEAMRTADAHIAALLAKHREGDRHE